MNAEIKQYLETIVKFQRESAHAGQRAHADKSQHAFILKHGRAMPFGRTEIAGPIQQCYSNAFNAAMSNPDLTYCEGYTESCGIPIEHAWCIDRRGKVIETTIRDREPRGYFGVPIRTDYLRKAIIKKKQHGFFDWMHPEVWVNVNPDKIVAKEKESA